MKTPSQVIIVYAASWSHCRRIMRQSVKCSHNYDGRSTRLAQAIKLKSVFCSQFCFFDWRNSSIVCILPQSANLAPRCCCQCDCCKGGGHQIQEGWLPKLGDCIGAKGNAQSYHIGRLNSKSTKSASVLVATQRCTRISCMFVPWTSNSS